MKSGLILPMGQYGSRLVRGIMPRCILTGICVGSVGLALLAIPDVLYASALSRVEILVGGLGLLGFWLPYHRTARKLAAANYRQCLSCRRPLPTMGNHGECATCREPYDIAATKTEFESPFSIEGSSNVPGPVRRLRRFHAVSMLLLAIGIIAGFSDLSHGHAWFMSVGAMGCFLLVSAAIHLCERRLIARVRLASYKVCPNCDYSLENAGPTGTCPECGRHFDVSLLRDDWVKHLEWYKG